jgi:hypothetical protein
MDVEERVARSVEEDTDGNGTVLRGVARVADLAVEIGASGWRPGARVWIGQSIIAAGDESCAQGGDKEAGEREGAAERDHRRSLYLTWNGPAKTAGEHQMFGDSTQLRRDLGDKTNAPPRRYPNLVARACDGDHAE